MSDIITDGMTKVAFVPAVADISAPDEDELAAGEDLESFLTPDGLGLEFGNDEVDVSALNLTFSSTLPGRQTLSGEITLKDQGRGAVPWSTFAGKPDGFLIVRRNTDATVAWAENDAVEVYPVQAGLRRPAAPAANEVAKFAVTLFYTSAPDLGATVAAGA